MKIENICVAGSGVLGFQIAFQTAFKGFKVVLYDINEQALDKAKEKFEESCKIYQAQVGATNLELQATRDNLTYLSDLAQACSNADLVIEAVPENPRIKIAFYHQLAKLAPSKTIFASNSSTLLPSKLASSTGRPKQFLGLHFANQIWIHNTAEIMGCGQTDPEVFNLIVSFAKNIGMIALPLEKEQPGYILNSLLIPFLQAATDLVVNEVTDFVTVDKTWMNATGAPMGPFGILDIVGITTVYNINKIKADKKKDPMAIKTIQYLQTQFIDKNKLGVSTKQGFYTYPNPAYKDKDFFK